MVTPNFLYQADEKGFDKAIVIYDLMHIASGYDLIQKEALMITLGTLEKKREIYRSYPLSAQILPSTRLLG